MTPNLKKNVFGQPLESCCDQPKTGFFRDGFCRTDDHDVGRHVVCGVVTDEFLDFTLQRGNDLVTARPETAFPGLKAGDRWCLCALRWLEAYQAGCAPKVDLKATDIKCLDYIPIEVLKEHAVEP